MRILVGITGASGALYGIRALQLLREAGVESHVIVSTWGARTIEHETEYSVRDVEAMADVIHNRGNMAATVSSGSFLIDGMMIAPCSVRTLAAIAQGSGENLICRAADVTLKERRRLVLLVRESPLSVIHLENMLKLAKLGVAIIPPTPAFYNAPTSLQDAVDYVTLRSLDQLGVHLPDEKHRWDGVLRR